MTVLAHQICLSPTPAQAQSFCSFAGCHRVVYNFALDSMRSWWAEYERSGRTIDKPNFPELKKTFNQLRRELFPWMNDPKAAHRDCWSQPFADLKKAYQAWWKGSAKAPTFKSKRSASSFYVANDKLTFDGKKVRLPKVGWVKMREPLRFEGKVLSARVRRNAAGRWLLSVQVEGDFARACTADGRRGIDLGLKHAVVLSEPLEDGRQVFDPPRPMRKLEKRLKHLQRRVSRRKKGSKRRQKAVRAVGKLHVQIRNLRKDWIHKMTTSIVRESQALGLEDLNIKGMQRTTLARSVSDVAMGEIHRQLLYKAELFGVEVKIWDRWYPSTKRCSSCGEVKREMPLSVRTYVCPCGLMMDRDLNAARNLVPGATREPSLKRVRTHEEREVARSMNRESRHGVQV